jgi:hypothetical protein
MVSSGTRHRRDAGITYGHLLSLYTTMKTIQIEIDVPVEVPDDVHWIAQEENGHWFGYDKKPTLNNYSMGGCWISATPAQPIDDILSPTHDWKNSLTKV